MGEEVHVRAERMDEMLELFDKKGQELKVRDQEKLAYKAALGKQMEEKHHEMEATENALFKERTSYAAELRTAVETDMNELQEERATFERQKVELDHATTQKCDQRAELRDKEKAWEELKKIKRPRPNSATGTDPDGASFMDMESVREQLRNLGSARTPA